ncbi:tail fiber assembly protein [Enterobacter hormaechei]
MNKFYFSAGNPGFYVDGVSTVPSDAVEVSEDIYSAFIGVPWPEGKQLGADVKGSPAWVDILPLTEQELTRKADAYKQRLLSAADDFISDWKLELMLGTISEADKVTLTEWMAYKRAVKAVDTNEPLAIVWPSTP